MSDVFSARFGSYLHCHCEVCSRIKSVKKVFPFSCFYVLIPSPNECEDDQVFDMSFDEEVDGNVLATDNGVSQQKSTPIFYLSIREFLSSFCPSTPFGNLVHFVFMQIYDVLEEQLPVSLFYQLAQKSVLIILNICRYIYGIFNPSVPAPDLREASLLPLSLLTGIEPRRIVESTLPIVPLQRVQHVYFPQSHHYDVLDIFSTMKEWFSVAPAPRQFSASDINDESLVRNTRRHHAAQKITAYQNGEKEDQDAKKARVDHDEDAAVGSSSSAEQPNINSTIDAVDGDDKGIN